MRLFRETANAISRPGVAQAGTWLFALVLMAGSEAAAAPVEKKAPANRAEEITRYIFIDITHQPSMCGRVGAPGQTVTIVKRLRLTLG